MRDERDLMDFIHKGVGCDFMSDLKNGENRLAAAKFMREMKLSEYSISQWNEALSYIFEKNLNLKSEEEIQLFLQNK